MAEALLGLKPNYFLLLFQGAIPDCIPHMVQFELELEFSVFFFFSDTYGVIQHDLQFSAVFISFPPFQSVKFHP